MHLSRLSLDRQSEQRKKESLQYLVNTEKDIHKN